MVFPENGCREVKSIVQYMQKGSAACENSLGDQSCAALEMGGFHENGSAGAFISGKWM